jgi:hypothetical protein
LSAIPLASLQGVDRSASNKEDKQLSWQALEDGNKELAEFGIERFASQVAYLATIQKDGSPRVHPVTPILGEGHLFVGMGSDSPKGYDLERNGRYAMHCSVADDDGGEGEFLISGRATITDDPELRAIAKEFSSYTVLDRHSVYELTVDSAILAGFTDVKASTLPLSGKYQDSADAVEAALAWPLTRYRIARLDPADQRRLKEETAAAIIEVDDLRWQTEIHIYHAVRQGHSRKPG